MSKHTPAPWNLVETKQENILPHWHIQIGEHSVSFFPYKRIYSEDRSMSGYVTDHEQMANAFLMAAAPELLEALEEAVDCRMVPKTSANEGGAAKYSRHVLVADKIRAAIAKAKGEQQ